MIGGGDCGPARLAAARAWWHRVAEHMPASAFYRAAGQIGLVPSPGGFWTPSFGTEAMFPGGKPFGPVLWPEHFGNSVTAAAVNYGTSPGDDHIADPYLYVGLRDGPSPERD